MANLPMEVPETPLQYYRNKVRVAYDFESGGKQFTITNANALQAYTVGLD